MRSHGFNCNSATTQNRGINPCNQATTAHPHHGVGEEILLTVVKREMYVHEFMRVREVTNYIWLRGM